MRKIKGYTVLADDGVRLLGTLDLIVMLEKSVKDKSRAKRNIRTDKKMIKWLKSMVRNYGIAVNPYKNAVLRQYNIANGREENAVAILDKLRRDKVDTNEKS